MTPDYTLPLDELPDPLPIVPLERPFDVTITPPGSKSITNRAYVLAALADGESRIIRPLRSDDCDALLEALCTLGATARWDGDDVLITGVNGRFPRGGHINLGDGGTPTRFMIACACLAAEPVVVDGSPRMRERPIAEGVDMLRQLGAQIDYIEEEGRLPVRVTPTDDFKGGELTIGRTASSQFISALMLIGSWLVSGIMIKYAHPATSESYLDLTLGVLAEWGGDYQTDRAPLRFSKVLSHQVARSELRRREYTVARDASSAVYWAVAVAVTPSSSIDIRIDTGDSEQPDLLCMDVLASAGVVLTDCFAGCVLHGPTELHAFTTDASRAPDGAVALGAGAAMCVGKSRITGLHTLRVKETDRVAALANELRKIGCTVETTDDSITIDPSTRHDEPVVIETYNDHRMAMAFAVLGLARPNIAIANPRCVSKSYPGFWRDFARLYQQKD
jgi:3-phosphoshikimate 1-carboxyvinyltransferase